MPVNPKKLSKLIWITISKRFFSLGWESLLIWKNSTKISSLKHSRSKMLTEKRSSNYCFYAENRWATKKITLIKDCKISWQTTWKRNPESSTSKSQLLSVQTVKILLTSLLKAKSSPNAGSVRPITQSKWPPSYLTKFQCG